jgi:hypothetical protein
LAIDPVHRGVQLVDRGLQIRPDVFGTARARSTAKDMRSDQDNITTFGALELAGITGGLGAMRMVIPEPSDADSAKCKAARSSYELAKAAYIANPNHETALARSYQGNAVFAKCRGRIEPIQ